MKIDEYVKHSGRDDGMYHLLQRKQICSVTDRYVFDDEAFHVAIWWRTLPNAKGNQWAMIDKDREKGQVNNGTWVFKLQGGLRGGAQKGRLVKAFARAFRPSQSNLTLVDLSLQFTTVHIPHGMTEPSAVRRYRARSKFSAVDPVG